MSTEDISLPSDKVQRKRRFTDQLNVVQEVEAKRSNNNLVDIEQEILNFHMDQQQQGEKNPNSLRTPEPKSSMSGSAKPANGTFRNVAPAQASSSSTSCSSSTANGTRKIVIRKFQQRNDPNTLNFDANWSILEDSVAKIQQRQSASVTCMELYNMVENLCQLNYTQEIYTRLQQLIRRFSELECARLVEKCEHVNFEAFLEMLNRLWETFCQQLSLIRSVFLYLDRTYRLQSATSISIWDLGLDAFRKFVVQNPNAGICPRTVSGILQLIELDRRGIQIDKHLLKSLLRMFMNLQIYERSFEREFLRVTEQFYKEESQTKIKELDVSQYLQFAQKRLLEEEERVHLYLEYSTYKKLIAIVDDCFITDNMDSIISDGPSQLLAENRIPELGLMYRLLSRVRDGQQALKNAFADYIKKTGRAMVMNTEQDKTLVSDLMAFKARLDIITVQSFEANERFQNASKDAFDFFVNTKPNKIAELIAKYMDSKLRTGNKECTEEELDSVMDRVIMLLRFVQGKDVFEAFYKKDLAKRLLLGRSASVDAEKAMLAKLRTECGAGLTQKLEGMFKDMEVSKDFCNTFKQYLDATDRDGSFLRLEVNVAILTMGHWPNYPTMEQANIPPQLAQLQQICAKFYTSKHNGRKLQWQYTLASGVLKAVFRPSVVKELEVSLFQAMVLLMFNDRTEWSYEQIFVSTKIDHLELKRTLQSLACGKFRVLQKQPRGREVSPGDNFIFNDEFNDRLYRIRISQVQMRETEQEHKQTEEQIFQDRQYQIDAAVVRIMKTRKKMTHNQLITDILTQLRFSVKAADLKKRIESLIERDYMTRDKEDPNMYHYVS